MFSTCCKAESGGEMKLTKTFGTAEEDVEWEEEDEEEEWEWEDDIDELHYHVLVPQVVQDPKCVELMNNLLAYARQQVQENINDIVSNLKQLSDAKAGGPLLEIDLLWPGSGYNAVACGGNYEVLCLLEKQGIVKVGDICGASGGACSALLALADPEGSRKLLFSYMVYAKWAEKSWDPQIWRAATIWQAAYRHAIEDDAAFERVRSRAYCACASGMTWKNVVMHQFDSREQIVTAFEATGEASIFGTIRGHYVDNASDKIGRCADLGNVAPFPGRKRKMLYYHTFYGYALKCTLESIELLFKKGVDETVLLMKSKDLRVPSASTYSKGMELALNGEGGMFVVSGEEANKQPQKTLIRPSATFFNVHSGAKALHPPKTEQDLV